MSLGTPFPIARTYWWNQPYVGDAPTVLAFGGDIQVTPPGLPAFQFAITGPDSSGSSGPYASSRLVIDHLDEFDSALDNQETLTSECGVPPTLPCTWSEQADGLSWHLTILGFQDPANPQGDYTQNLMVPFPSNTLVAPVMASLSVDTSSTTTMLSSSSASTQYGQPVTLTASVSPVPFTGGTMAFKDGGQTIPGCGVQPVDETTGEATCTSSALSVGEHTITAVYSGAIGFDGSPSSSITQTVSKAYTSLTVAPASKSLGSVTFSATLTRQLDGGGVPGEPVVFSYRGQKLCQTTTNSSGVASCKVTGLAIVLGSATYTGNFAGDSNYYPSSGTGKL